MTERRRLPNRRACENFELTCSLALQFGAELETIRKALCRDGQGRASGPLGAALDILAEGNPR
jgi:hypothetical protein